MKKIHSLLLIHQTLKKSTVFAPHLIILIVMIFSKYFE